MVGVIEALAGVDEAARGEVRPLDHLHEVVHAGLRIVQQDLQSVAELAQVVRRNVGGHAHGDARGAVKQQIGHLGGQDGRFLQGVVVVGTKVHGLLVQIGQEFPGQPGHAHFGVTHGGRRVPVDGAEVALPVHQRVPHGEVLRHAHQRVIHGGVAMRMILTDDVTHDARGLLVRTVVGIGQFRLREEYAPVHGLQTVARIGDGAADDDRQRIFQIGFPQFVLNTDFRLLGHVFLVAWVAGRPPPARYPDPARSGHCVR